MSRPRFDETDEEYDARQRRRSRAPGYIVLGVLLCTCGAIFYPVWQASRPASPQAQALSKLKQIDLAFQMYAGDNNDHFPLASNWMDSTAPYLGRGEPSEFDRLGTAFRRHLSGANDAEINDPQQVAMLFNARNTSRNASGELDLLPNPPQYRVTGHEVNTIGFVDGHASFTLPGILVK